MPNYAKNYTGIYQLKYESGDWVGTASFRYPYAFNPNPNDNFVAAIGNIFADMKEAFFTNFNYLSARIIPANQTESYPWVTPDNASVVAAGASALIGKIPEDQSFVVSFVGRNNTSRATVYLGGMSSLLVMQNSGITPWRTTSTEWDVVGLGVNALNAAVLAAPNNGHALFDKYMNYKFNNQIQTKTRK